MKHSFDSANCLRFATVAGVCLILLRVWRIWAAGGLFFTFGLDYAIYGAAADVVVNSGWSHLYDKEANTRELARWLHVGFDRTDPSSFVACPYPAPFVLPFLAANRLGHLGGFAAWTTLNILLYAAIVRGLSRGAGRTGLLMTLAPFAFFPFLWTLYLGQLVIVMAFGLYRSLRAFEAGRELAAGCWLGLVLLKPQFGLIPAIVLLGKRRWSALAGLGLAAAGLAASTFALAGAEGVRGYLDILRSFSGFRRVPSIVNPLHMINFRGILVQLLPESWSEDQATGAVLVLSAAMTLSLAAVWRGSWQPRDARFPRQILATLIVTLFAGFHSHVHGATLLIVPMLAAIRSRRDPDPLLGLYVLLIFVPTFSVAFNGVVEHAAWIVIVLMAGLYATVIAELARGRGASPAREPAGAATAWEGLR